MKSVRARIIPFVSSAFLLTVLAFSAGVAVGTYRLWPYFEISDMHRVVTSILTHGKITPKRRLVEAPKYASRKRITIHNPHLLAPGFRVFVGWDDNLGHYSAWLYDVAGNKLHTWKIDYTLLDGTAKGSINPHGFNVLPDGSIIVSFSRGGNVMARLDKCGSPVWKKEGHYHHSIERAENGSYWAWRGDESHVGQYQYIENFVPETGATIKELDLINDIIKKIGSESSIIFSMRPEYKFERSGPSRYDDGEKDIFHPNDIDVLYSNIADRFPGFEAGDLLISIRNTHLVAVLDPNDMEVKWSANGPWRFQHDPDFTVDGRISVYNNNPDRARSEIITIDPATRKITNELFGGEARFYSRNMGKHQYLPNGNILIVIPGEGRILEVTSKGSTVFEFNNLRKNVDEYNGHVQNGLWVPAGYFETIPDCS